jgi:hypothetical protein
MIPHSFILLHFFAAISVAYKNIKPLQLLEPLHSFHHTKCRNSCNTVRSGTWYLSTRRTSSRNILPSAQTALQANSRSKAPHYTRRPCQRQSVWAIRLLFSNLHWRLSIAPMLVIFSQALKILKTDENRRWQCLSTLSVTRI